MRQYVDLLYGRGANTRIVTLGFNVLRGYLPVVGVCVTEEKVGRRMMTRFMIS